MTGTPYNPADDPDAAGQDTEVEPGTEPPKPERGNDDDTQE